MRLVISFAFAIFCLTGALEAQIDTLKQADNLVLIGQYRGGRVKLRWSPALNRLFEQGVKHGYKLERSVMGTNEFEPVNTDQGRILPVGKTVLQSVLDTNSEAQLIVAGVLYGDGADSLVRTPMRGKFNTDDIATRSNILDTRRFMVLMAADFDWKAALMAGLAFEDASVVKDMFYVYRLTNWKTPKGFEPDTVMVAVSTYEEISYPTAEVEVFGWEKKVTLIWPRGIHGSQFTGYYIERKTDGSSYSRRNKLPFSPLLSDVQEQTLQKIDTALAQFVKGNVYYTDSVDSNYLRYRYRIIGLSPFGEEWVVAADLIGFGRDRTPPDQVSGVRLEKMANGFLKVSWAPAIDPNGSLKGYTVQKGLKVGTDTYYTEVTENLLAPGVTQFVDREPIINDYCYYRVNAIDTAGNRSFGIPKLYAIEDTIPPLNPERIQAVLDTSGTLRLQFSRSKSSDAEKYMVYYAYNQKDDFLPWSGDGLADTSWIVSNLNVKVLNRKLFVRLMTIDRAGNTSAPSPITEVVIPDIIPPLTPTLQSSELSDGLCKAVYEKSGSEDVSHYVVQRSVNSAMWSTFYEIGAEKVSGPYLKIQDTLKVTGVSHKLRVLAVDGAGLISTPSDEAVFIDRSMPKAKACVNFKATHEPQLQWVRLTWSHPKAVGTEFVLYRKTNGGKLHYLGRVKGVTEYNDRDIRAGDRYEYVILAKSATEAESAPSSSAILLEK